MYVSVTPFLYCGLIMSIIGIACRSISASSSTIRIFRPFRHPFELHSRLAAVQDHDPVAGVEESVLHLCTQPLAEGEQQHHGDGSPGDRHNRQDRARPLDLQVQEEVFEKFKPHRRPGNYS